MNQSASAPQNPLRLAERILQLLDEGSFASTYKYAVLIALMDLCLEKTSQSGQPPETLTTAQLAEKIIQLYWPHTQPYDNGSVLRQVNGGTEAQAEIVKALVGFRKDATLEAGQSLPLARARAQAGQARWQKLVDSVEWTLIEMPLPRLQILGQQEDRFLYELGWSLDKRHRGWKVTVTQAQVRAYQQGRSSPFDNRIHLKPGIAEQLIALSGVLRPLIHRQWSVMVAKMNRLEEARLEQFLFGATRIALSPVRAGLRELQHDRCFYCGKRLDERQDIDHFIPWARHPDNCIDNLVLSHASCNLAKRDFLAAAEHVERWRERALTQRDSLAAIAQQASWEVQPERALNVSRAIYRQLPSEVRLWRLGRDFVPFERERVLSALGESSG